MMDILLKWDRAVGERYPDLTMLRKCIWRGTLSEKEVEGSKGSTGDDDFPPRSLLWKVLLLYGTFDKKSWSASQERDLRSYTLFREQYGGDIDVDGNGSSDTMDGPITDTQNSSNGSISNPTTNPSSSPSKSSVPIITTRVVDDPLSSQSLSSFSLGNTSAGTEFEDIDLTLDSYYEDEEDLNDIIMRDVDRAFPEVDFFRDPEVRSSLHRILYIYARQNREIGYRQGMHELAGPMLWVMSKDASKGMNDKYVESDAYAVFQSIMKNGKVWYLPPKKQSLLESGSESDPIPAIVSKSKKIQESILKIVDPELYNILVSNEIEPQIWGIRWIRLIFGREFGFNQMLRLWDALFAADGLTLELIDYICVTMLLRVRRKIIEEPHYAEILTTLLNYPTDPIEPPYLYVINGLYLKSHLNLEGGRYVYEQFEKFNQVERQDVLKEKSINLTPPLRSQGSSSPSLMISPLLTLPSITSSSFNLDSIRDAAKSVSKKLDIDRRVRDAFEKPRARALSPSNSKGVSIAEQQLLVIEQVHQDRNERLADLLTSSLSALERRDGDIQLAQALDCIRHVRECLLDETFPVNKAPVIFTTSTDAADAEMEVEKEQNRGSILLKDTPLMRYSNNLVKTPVKTDIEVIIKTEDDANDDVVVPSSSPTKPVNTHTPIRTSLLANSDFSWMLDSPGPSPPDIRSTFKGSQGVLSTTEGPLQRKAADIFELL